MVDPNKEPGTRIEVEVGPGRATQSIHFVNLNPTLVNLAITVARIVIRVNRQSRSVISSNNTDSCNYYKNSSTNNKKMAVLSHNRGAIAMILATTIIATSTVLKI